MIHFAVAFALLAHVLFWGAGAAMLAMPRPWHRFWPVLVLPMGFGLQSAVVWIGAHTNLPGTNSYALASEALPAVLLALALWRFGWRPSVTNVSRFGLVWAGVAACLALLVLPLALASGGLTTISLGSCDAADYAGGARVLMEFARGDREGFLGLTEVTYRTSFSVRRRDVSTGRHRPTRAPRRVSRRGDRGVGGQGEGGCGEGHGRWGIGGYRSSSRPSDVDERRQRGDQGG